MNFLCLIIGGSGVFLVGYFLGRDHGFEEAAGQLNSIENDRENAIFERDLACAIAHNKVKENAKLRQALMSKREVMLRPGSRN